MKPSRFLLIIIVSLLFAVQPGRTEEIKGNDTIVTWKQVEKKIRFLSKSLENRQRKDGSVPFDQSFYIVGMTALAGYALLEAGEPVGKQSIQRMITYCRITIDANWSVYNASLCAMFLAKADAVKYRGTIEQCAKYLIQQQLGHGMWAYGAKGRDGRGISESGDNSNTQFAILGLKAAYDCGIKIPDSVWRRARNHFRTTQNDDGGWGYADWTRGTSYCAMTAAALASLWIIKEVLDGKSRHCETVVRDEIFEKGKQYLDKNFSPKPRFLRLWHAYFLYAIERTGIITANRYIGEYDWYRAGAMSIVNMGASSTPEIAFSLLFLAKAKTPLIIQKLARPGRDWDNDHYDLDNLTNFYSENTTRRVTWQTARMRGDASDLLEAPVLLISGRRQLRFSTFERNTLKEYLLNGGTVIALPASDSEEFDRSFRETISEMYAEAPLVPLPKHHPVYTCFFEIPFDDRPTIYSLSQGCVVNLLYVPRGKYTCKWTTNDTSRFSFEMGCNLIAFLSGDRKLKNRIDPVAFTPISELTAELRERPPRGAVIVGQVKHSGQWKPLRNDVVHLMEHLRDKAGVTVGRRPEPVDLSTDDPYHYPILFMTGLYNFSLGDAECKRLRRFIEKGGFLFADPACGREEFEKAFRKFIVKVFPDKKLEEIPLGHDIFTIGYDVRKVKYRPTVTRVKPGLKTPVLEGIKIGNRYGVVFSPYNFSCGLDGMPVPICRGYMPDDSVRIAVNIMLYALNN